MGQEKMMSSHNKMNDGAKEGDFLGQEKLTYGHDKTNFGTEQGDFLGQEKSIFGSLRDELWDIMMCVFGTGEVDIWVIPR
jgi:hypothetical protein